MATFLLVHGAWHGGCTWRRTARLLRQDGHDVYAPSLTGLGDRSHLLAPNITLSTHVRDVSNLIENEELHDVMLCGHSYAGLVVAQVADRMPNRVGGIVFLDAFLPQDGMSLLDLLPPAIRTESEVSARQHGAGWLLQPPPASKWEVANEADERWLEEHCGPQPLATFTEPSRLTGAWRTVSRLVYVAATQFSPPVFKQFAEIAKEDPVIAYHELACGHEVMLDMPDELHRILTATPQLAIGRFTP